MLEHDALVVHRLRRLHDSPAAAAIRQAGGWEAFTTYVEPRGRVVTEWVPTSRLRPVEESPPFTGSAYG